MTEPTDGDACPLPNRKEDDRTRELLGEPRVVAIVGMSPKRERASNQVARYLRDHGFTIIPVHPKETEIEGMKVYADLTSIPADIKIDIVDLFVAPHRTGPVVEQAKAIGAPIVWFQLGAEHEPSEARARELGLEVFSHKCTKAEHERLFGN